MINVTNNNLIEIVGVIETIICVFMMSFYYSKLLKPRKESKYYILKYFFTITIVYLICRCNNTLYESRFIPMTLSFMITPFIFSKEKVSKKLFAPLPYIIGTILINFLLNFVIILRFDLTVEQFNNMPYEEYMIVDHYGLVSTQSMAYTLLTFVVMTTLLIRNKNLKRKIDIFLINFMLCLVVITSCLSSYFFIDFENKIHLVIGLANFSIAVFIMIFTYSRIHFYEEYYKQKAENEFLKDKSKMQLDYYKDMVKKEEEIKKINHDIKNNIQVMSSLKKAEEKEKLMFKINEKLKENEIIKYSKLEILNIILNLKKKEAEQNNIDLSIEIRNNISFMEEIDISNLFSNILDNAIENISSKDKRIDLVVYKKMNYTIVKCSNVIDSRKKKVDKGKYHGYGLKIIDDIAKKYNGEVKINQDKNKYEITILLAED